MSRRFSNHTFTSKYATYFVFVGRKPGLYETWKEAEAQVSEFSGSRFQGFSDLAEAKHAYRRFLKEGKIVTKKKRKPKREKTIKPNVLDDNLPPWDVD